MSEYFTNKIKVIRPSLTSHLYKVINFGIQPIVPATTIKNRIRWVKWEQVLSYNVDVWNGTLQNLRPSRGWNCFTFTCTRLRPSYHITYIFPRGRNSRNDFALISLAGRSIIWNSFGSAGETQWFTSAVGLKYYPGDFSSWVSNHIFTESLYFVSDFTTLAK